MRDELKGGVMRGDEIRGDAMSRNEMRCEIM